MTALHYAALLDNEDVVAVLLAHRASPLLQVIHYLLCYMRCLFSFFFSL